MAGCVLELDNVSKGFARGQHWIPVLQCVSLAIAPGEVVSVVGTRDQGKTTLLRIAAGTLPPDEGAVRLGGRNLVTLNDRERAHLLRHEVGLATRTGPGARAQVREYVGLRVTSGRWFDRRGWRRRLVDALDLVGVVECADARWRDLSNWQRVRVELAQAVACRPSVVLVDDLLDGLTFGQRVQATDILRGLGVELGCGILMACSDQISALGADRIWRLDDGKLRLMADIAEVESVGLEDAVCRDEAAG